MHEAQVWNETQNCLFDVCLGQRYSVSTDQKSRRRKISGRFAASAGANAAFVYAAYPYNPQRYSSPDKLILPKVQAITDACAAHSWTVARSGWKHRRDDAAMAALLDCRTELERFSSTEWDGDLERQVTNQDPERSV